MADNSIRKDRRPLYEQAQAVIVSRIADGTYAPGAQLPREDEMASQLGVSRTTIRSALGGLEALGYIKRIHGAGTFVAEHRFKVEAQLDALESFHPRLAARAGLSSRIAHVTIEEAPADAEVAAAMRVAVNSPVIRIVRSVMFDEVPVAWLEDYLPTARFTVSELRDRFRDSVVDYFDGQEGRPIADWSDSLLIAAQADENLSLMLKVHKGSALFRLDEAFYDVSATLLSWSRNFIVPEYFRFHMHRRIVHGERINGRA